MSRADLLALTLEAVAALTNLGLVKRALREIEAGQGPALEEAEDRTVSGLFPDGVMARLPPGVPLREASCTCGAAGVCRHRVAVALAYARWHASVAPGAERTGEVWSPGAIGDDALLSVLGKRGFERARGLKRLGCDIEVRRGRAPEAALPTSTVRFLVPKDLSYARCECALGQACEHVALAVWAFREADERDPAAAVLTVHLALAATAQAESDPLGEAVGFCRRVLIEGVAQLPKAAAARLARAKAALDAAGMTWPGTILDELEESVEAYRQRSARYSAGLVARLLGEMAARARAVRQEGELPAPYVLGIGESRETLLGHVRLVALGARVDGHGRERWAEVFLADPVAGLVLVLRKDWRYGEDEAAQDGARLGERTVATGIRLRELAAGQIVTHIAKRSANRALRLGAVRRGTVSVTPQAGSWDELPDGLFVRDLARYGQWLKARPPRWLRPRVLAESVHVVPVGEVEALAYSPGEQALRAVINYPSGETLSVVKHHRTAAPQALDVLAAALSASPRFLSGHLYRGHHGPEMIPLAVVTDRVVVPDLEATVAPMRVPVGQLSLEDSPMATALAESWTALEEAAHAGLLRPPPDWVGRAERSGARLEGLGLREAGRRLRELAARVRGAALSAGADSAEAARAAEAWEGAALRITLTKEAL